MGKILRVHNGVGPNACLSVLVSVKVDMIFPWPMACLAGNPKLGNISVKFEVA